MLKREEAQGWMPRARAAGLIAPLWRAWKPGSLRVVAASIELVLLVLCVRGDKLQQYPFFDVDGWSCHGRGCQELRTLHGSLVGQDTDETTWFFSAPQHIVVQLACANTVSFRITHPEFDAKGRDAAADFDVVVSDSVRW